MNTYDASLKHLASRISAGDWQALDSLLALASTQGEQVTRLLNERMEHLQRIEASFARRHNEQRKQIESQAKEIARLKRELGSARGAA